MAAKENEKMTIEQVAEALGVSKTTVSRALSGKGRISEKTRAKVFAYMGHARTEPASAQKDPKVRTNNIAMVVPQRFITLDLPFLRKCMGGICTMADQRGYDMLLCYASSTEYTQLQRQLASHKVDGVILTYAMADDPCVDLLRQYDVPFVLIGRSEDKTIPQADNDQVTAACEMTRILLQMGAKRIALLVGSTIYAVNTDRTRGYLRGFAESCKETYFLTASAKVQRMLGSQHMFVQYQISPIRIWIVIGIAAISKPSDFFIRISLIFSS